MKKVHSIRFKITAITIATILVTILSVIAVSYSAVRRETERKSVEMMRLIGRDTQNTLDEYFVSVEQAVGMAANEAADTLDSVVLIECGAVGSSAGKTEQTPEQKARLDTYLTDHCKQIKKTYESVASHTPGAVTYYYCIDPGISQTNHGFYFSRVGKAGFVEQDPLDARGLDAEDLLHNAWYFTPIKRGRPSWVGPYKDTSLDEMWVCSYLVPIYNADTFIGVLGMDIPLDTLVEQVSSIRVYENGFASLCDEEGHVLYYPDLVQGKVPAFLKLPDSQKMLQKESSNDELIRYMVDGQKRQLSFSTLRNGMKLLIIAPVKEINASWMNLIRIILIVTAVAICIYAVLLMFAMNLITRPLLRLTAASKRLANADYDVELPYESQDEVGELTAAFRLMRDKIKEYIQDLNRRIYTDDMTGLPNMRFFFELAEVERVIMLEKGQLPVILYFNLIGMKHFNRQYGFEEGNRLICSTAEILSRHFGKQKLCRVGQDHFVAVSDEMDLEKKLRKIFKECQESNGGNNLPVRVGIYRNSIEDVNVSVACDRAKYACDLRRDSYESGFSFFEKGMQEQVMNIRYVINHLEKAISEKWIQVYYQPIVRASTEKVCDEEALARWIDPDRGMLSPAEFIPALEGAGLIYKLDLYVVEQVLEKIKQQQEAGLFIVPHSINLSRSDFEACDIVEEICKRVDKAGVARDRITIEITESIIGSDFEFMKKQVERFQSLGFNVWMDDFGSGYSSLDVLQSIKFDLIKFDMGFMRKLDEGESGRIILTELMKMAAALGVETICEGVETEEHSRFLQAIGCNKLQGYYYCRPIPLSEIIRRYREGFQIGYESPGA